MAIPQLSIGFGEVESVLYPVVVIEVLDAVEKNSSGVAQGAPVEILSLAEGVQFGSVP